MAESTARAAVLAGRVRAAVEAIIALGATIEAAPPLGPDARLGDAEDAWGPREVLAHVTEAAAYWHGEIERILAGDPASPVAFGRLPSDMARVAILSRDRTLPAAVLLARLGREGAAVADRIGALTDQELDRTGVHPRRGPQTVADLIDWGLASHFEGHAAQIRDAAG